jgi:hypothetical protein
MLKKIGLLEVKQALRDGRFRERLPPELNEDIQKYLQNPGCACNLPIYRRVMQYGGEQLKAYFPDKELPNIEEEIKNLAQNHWLVINCNISELEGRLTKLPPGRKQIAVARYEDQVTVIVNELDYLY